ncbi:MAG: hypothetical protein R3251_04390 [Candidatus Spechtbacterales bacterium]|nr:hypothetical protein [Candidatus Spechtbacterales bacterium]
MVSIAITAIALLLIALVTALAMKVAELQEEIRVIKKKLDTEQKSKNNS